MMQVKFIKSRTPYLAGEIAAFDDDKAQALIRQGYATVAGNPGTEPDKPKRAYKTRDMKPE